jgi:hypothetical protein
MVGLFFGSCRFSLANCAVRLSRVRIVDSDLQLMSMLRRFVRSDEDADVDNDICDQWSSLNFEFIQFGDPQTPQ